MFYQISLMTNEHRKLIVGDQELADSKEYSVKIAELSCEIYGSRKMP